MRAPSAPDAMILYGILLALFGLGIAPTITAGSPALLATAGWFVATMSAVATLMIFLVRVIATIHARQSLAERFRFRFSLERWREGDVERVATLGEQSIGTGHPPLELIRERLERNRDTLVIARRQSHPPDGNDIAGYIMLYPLTIAAMRRIDRGQIRSGFDLKPDDICRTFTRPSALYIAMIYGNTTQERAFVLAALRERLMAYTDWQRPRKVYARAATRVGARLLRQAGFETVAGNNDIVVVDYASLAAALSQ